MEAKLHGRSTSEPHERSSQVISFSPRWKVPEWDSPNSFNLGVGGFGFQFLSQRPRLYLNVPVWLYNAFRRVYDDPADNCWGFGLLQVGGRHLLGIIENGEVFKIDFAFLHVVLVDKSAPSGGDQ